jgi:hypothetical protein
MCDAGLLDAEREASEPARTTGHPRRWMYRVTGAGEVALRAARVMPAATAASRAVIA